MLDLKKLYVCPYCGIEDMLKYFIIKIGKQFVKCPLCGKRMYIKTLLAEFTPEEWGKWIYVNIRLFSSPKYRFYDDVSWDILWANLNKMKLIGKGFKDGFYGAKKDWGNYNAKEWLNQIELKYDMKKEKTLTWDEKKKRGLVLNSYMDYRGDMIENKEVKG